MVLSIELRREWQAKPPSSTKMLNMPVTTVFCGLRTPSKGCSDSHSCGQLCREMQDRDMADGMPDIRYNFLIGGDNKVYEGRGWTSMPTLPGRYLAMTPQSIYIAFIGSLSPGARDCGSREDEGLTFVIDDVIHKF